MIVQYYADSLGQSRPGVVKLSERYIYLFFKWLEENYREEIFVVDRSHGGATLRELYDYYIKDVVYISEEKEILLIHAGICDCAPRPLPLYLRNFVSSLPSFLRDRIVFFLHKYRSTLLRNGFVFYRTTKIMFEKTLTEWIKHGIDHFKITYVINIAPTNQQTENQSPGLSKGINTYNQVIKNVIDEFPESKVKLIDINFLLRNEPDLDQLILKDDGHHITSFAHRLYFQELKMHESKRH